MSSLLHLAAAAAALVAAIPLVKLGCRRCTHHVLLGIYAACVVALLATSGIYHALARDGVYRPIMQKVDYVAIWLVIAGTITAVHGVTSKGVWRTAFIAIVWGYALTASFLQMCWFGTFSGTVGLVLYLVLGWSGLISILKLRRRIGWPGVLPFFYAGVVYSAGAIQDAWLDGVRFSRWLGPHEVFHVAVIVGVAVHWAFIRNLVLRHAQGDERVVLLSGSTAARRLVA